MNRIGKSLVGLLGAVAIGVAVGTAFSFAYPTVEITSGLASLFGLIGLGAVLIIYAVVRWIKRP